MISLRAVVVMFTLILGFTCAAPKAWGYSHKHVKIIVPSHYHTEHVHHHHVEKVHVPVHVPVPVVKKVFIPIESHHEPIIEHHGHHDAWQGGWW